MNLEKYLLLDVRKIFLIIGAFIISILIHNFFYALTFIEEPVFFLFFLLAVVVIPVYFIISVLYTIFHHVKRIVKKKR
jgi:uncharacterized paraquat-inducible protein A